VTGGSGEHGNQASARLHRLSAAERRSVHLFVDGAAITALDGDTVLTAILSHRGALRRSEWRRQPRAGFCLMGVCQDCWVWCEDGTRLRACSAPARADLRVLTRSPLEPAQ